MPHLRVEGKVKFFHPYHFQQSPVMQQHPETPRGFRKFSKWGHIMDPLSAMCIPKHLYPGSSCFQPLAAHYSATFSSVTQKGWINCGIVPPQCRCSEAHTSWGSPAQGCSDAIQLSLTHQVSPLWLNLFPSPGIFLAGTQKTGFNSRKTNWKSQTKQVNTSEEPE